MYVLLWIACLCLLCTHVIPWQLWVLPAIVYALSYFDGKEYTGERHYPQLRALRLWRRVLPVQYYFLQKADLLRVEPGQTRRMYVVSGCDTLLPLLYGVGLHGGALGDCGEHLRYVVPRIYMAIPIVRDFLLWTGAVTHKRGRDNPMDACHTMLFSKGCGTCFAPSHFDPPPLSDAAAAAVADLESAEASTLEAAFGFARPQATASAVVSPVQLVPILVCGERNRYRIIDGPLWFQKLRRYTFAHLGYAFPTLFWRVLCNSSSRPTHLTIIFGGIITCDTRYPTAKELCATYAAQIESMKAANETVAKGH